MLFGNIDWLKTGHMTFYEKLHCTDITNYSNTHAIKVVLKNFKVFIKFQNFNI